MALGSDLERPQYVTLQAATAGGAVNEGTVPAEAQLSGVVPDDFPDLLAAAPNQTRSKDMSDVTVP